MEKPLVLVIPESNLDTLKEVTELLTKYNILTKVLTNEDFDIMFNIDCDTVNVDMSDETFLTIAKQAHEKDLTFNQMITNLLREQLERESNI